MLLIILWVMWGLVAPLILALYVGYLLRHTESGGLIWAGAAVVVGIYLFWMWHLGGWPPAVVSWQSLVLACVCVLLVVFTIGSTALEWPEPLPERPLNLSEANR